MSTIRIHGNCSQASLELEVVQPGPRFLLVQHVLQIFTQTSASAPSLPDVSCENLPELLPVLQPRLCLDESPAPCSHV